MPGLVHPVRDERDALTSYLTQQRYLMRVAAYGLTDEQARATPTVSTLSVGGLIKHVASVERVWMETVTQEPRATAEDYEANFRMEPTETLAGIFEIYDASARATDETLGALDLAHEFPVPKGVPWFPADVEAWSVRWVYLHLVQETARHAGHADIIREAIDGATGFPLMAAVDGLPATEWMQPWQPPS